MLKTINANRIELYCFKNLNEDQNCTNQYNYPICFTGYDTSSVFLLLNIHNLIHCCSFQHGLYLGTELLKAELSGLLKQIYIQN